MKNSNLYFLLSWFLIGFGLSYILLNSSKWVGGKNADDSAFSNNYDKYGYIESRQNLNSTNYVRLPKFRGSNDRLFSTSGSSNFAQQTKTASHIEANYSVRINEKNDMKVGQTNGVGYSSFGPAYNNFSTNTTIKNSNNSNNSINSSSELSNINSQIASIRSSYTVKSTQEPENQKKINHGFLSVNANMTTINSSISIFTNNIQKVDGDPGDPGAATIIDPGDGGEMGEPIPVGDGWILLFMMALVYGSLKGLKEIKSLKF